MFRIGRIPPARKPVEFIVDWTSDALLKHGATPSAIARLNVQFADLADKVTTLTRVVARESDRRGITVTVYPSGGKPAFDFTMNPGQNYKRP